MKKIIALVMTLSLIFMFGCSSNSAKNTEDILNKDQKEIEKLAKGSTVNFYGWGGNEVLNKWFDTYVIPNMKEKYDISVKRVGMDIDTIMNKLLSEKKLQNDNGNIDVFWLNGENFKSAKDNDLLFGPFTSKIENYEKYVDTKSKDITTDFGTPVDNMESPWGKATFTVFKNGEKVENQITDTKSLKEAIMKNPGKFTYPAPPDFTGSAFVRNIIYDTVGYEKVANLPEDEKQVKEAIQPAIDYLNEIKPYLWNKGKTYPSTIAQLNNMYSDNEVYFSMSYSPNEVKGKIDSGEFNKNTQFINFDKGNISNTHFLAIPKNAKNKAGSMVLINYLTSIDAQASKSNPKNWGDMTILDLNKVPSEDRSKFKSSIDIKNPVPEIKASLVPIIEKIWIEEVANSNE
ncbi:putative ABC transporter solute-binding protein [[Clostridium] sordellii]|uniref:ABC transporter substrate-binding protein n=1 Tax=Paraclostridium sordellii TaxID=1505 RepID=UPI000543915C|nr:ABC transporter substrate-binding protein [Paeniclostridium sordellii]CEK30218.1 putative ABC transporter solute-binding protein [[Clostridium] sordellii] [Paeniclostridium sordellii]